MPAACALAQYPTLADPSAQPAEAALALPSAAAPTFPVPIYPEQAPLPPSISGNSLPLAVQNQSVPDSIRPTTIFTYTPYRNSAWRAEIGVIPGASLNLAGRFDNWPQHADGLRFSAGYENPNGLGVRFRFSVGGNTGTFANGNHFEATFDTFSVDLYKRLFLENTELVVGAGGSDSDITLERAGLKSDFVGGGATAFAELWHPFLRWGRTDFGLAGRGRLTISPGNWHDTTGGDFVGETKHDTLTITEIAYGLEIRRRFGPLEDKYFYFMLLADYQNFNSPWMTVWTGTAASICGLNITTGIAY